MVIDQKQKEILNWLKCNDPSINHESACNKREPTTGNWFLEGEIFHRMDGRKYASLWLHGIPGAGKTVLCSTVIEHVKTLCDNDDRYAYFYFDFNDPQKAICPWDDAVNHSTAVCWKGYPPSSVNSTVIATMDVSNQRSSV